MVVWKLKACPRCGGDMFVENGSCGWHEQCLQCAYQRDLEVIPTFRRQHEIHQTRPTLELASVGAR